MSRGNETPVMFTAVCPEVMKHLLCWLLCVCRESIFGYKDLEVQMFYTAGKLIPYMHLNFTDRVSVTGTDGVFVSLALEESMVTIVSLDHVWVAIIQ